MRSVICFFSVYAFISSALWADTVNLGNGTWQTFNFNSSQPSPVQGTTPASTSTPLTGGTPFWNNYSDDTGVGGSHDMNVGYMLTGTGGAAGTDVLGTDSVATMDTTSTGGDPNSFTFNTTPNTYNIQLLAADSSMSTSSEFYGTVYGVYYMSGDSVVYDPIYGPGYNSYGDTASIPFPSIGGATTFGFYAAVCYAPETQQNEQTLTSCPSQYTEYYYSGGGNTGYITNNESSYYDAGAYDHFALFGLNSDPNANYAIGFKDGPVPAEGLGDFQDVLIELVDPSAAVPEPSTLGVVGFGLAAVALIRFAMSRFGTPRFVPVHVPAGRQASR